MAKTGYIYYKNQFVKEKKYVRFFEFYFLYFDIKISNFFLINIQNWKS